MQPSNNTQPDTIEELLAELRSGAINFDDKAMSLITAYGNQCRVDELNHVAVNDEELILCYFTQENPDCSEDISIEERIAALKAQSKKNEL